MRNNSRLKQLHLHKNTIIIYASCNMLHQKNDHEEKKNSLKFLFLNPKQKMERIDKLDFKK